MLADNTNETESSRSPSGADYGLNKALYSINETLVLTDLGRTCLYDLINRGELPLIKIGKRSMIAAPDLVNFLNSRRVTASAA